MDGLYEFNIQSPMGNIKALLNLITNGNTFHGYVDVMGKRNEFNNGRINGNVLSLVGRFSAGMMNIQYTITRKYTRKYNVFKCANKYWKL